MWIWVDHAPFPIWCDFLLSANDVVTKSPRGSVADDSCMLLVKSPRGSVADDSCMLLVKSPRGSVADDSCMLLVKSPRGSVADDSYMLLVKSPRGSVADDSSMLLVKSPRGSVADDSSMLLVKSPRGSVADDSYMLLVKRYDFALYGAHIRWQLTEQRARQTSNFCFFVQDESHFLKNMKSVRAKRALPILKASLSDFASIVRSLLCSDLT